MFEKETLGRMSQLPRRMGVSHQGGETGPGLMLSEDLFSVSRWGLKWDYGVIGFEGGFG